MKLTQEMERLIKDALIAQHLVDAQDQEIILAGIDLKFLSESIEGRE